MDVAQLKTYIVEPILKGLKLYSDEACNLVLGTCAQESQMGRYIRQVNGPALGIYQMEPRTHDDIWQRYLPSQARVTSDLMIICKFAAKPTSYQLVHNLFYATAMCRIFYLRIPDTIPKTLEGQAEYYKRWYNTPLGAATTDQYIANYKRYVLGESNGKGKGVQASKG
jgi:hypothetical protein